MENAKLSEDLETQKLNLRDINEFLTNELKARSLTTSAMEAKVVELYHLLDDVNKSHEVRDMDSRHCIECGHGSCMGQWEKTLNLDWYGRIIHYLWFSLECRRA